MLRTGIVLYPGFQVMNLAVVSVLEFTNLAAGKPVYQPVLLSEHGGPVRSSAGFSVETQAFDKRRFDTVLVVGDNQISTPPQALIAFLQRAARRSRRIGSTCTGAFVLAQAGLLDGRRATTHWFFARQFRRSYPNVKLEDDRIFIIDGPLRNCRFFHHARHVRQGFEMARMRRAPGFGVIRQPPQMASCGHRRRTCRAPNSVYFPGWRHCELERWV